MLRVPREIGETSYQRKARWSRQPVISERLTEFAAPGSNPVNRDLESRAIYARHSPAPSYRFILAGYPHRTAAHSTPMQRHPPKLIRKPVCLVPCSARSYNSDPHWAFVSPAPVHETLFTTFQATQPMSRIPRPAAAIQSSRPSAWPQHTLKHSRQFCPLRL